MDINDIPTTGASCATAKQDKLKVCGVEASRRLAQNDLGRINKYKSNILSVAKQKNTDPSIIAAIMSRESRGGSVLKDGWGDHNNGFGLMQVDKRHHTPQGTWDSETHIAQAVDIFNSTLIQIEKKFPGQSKESILKDARSQSCISQYPGLVSAEPGLAQHLQTATLLINSSLSRNTLKAYQTAWRAFNKFLTHHSEETSGIKHILAFISHCHTQLTLSHNTMRLYLAGIQHFLSLRDPAKPYLLTSHAIRAILRGIQKLQPVVSIKRLPITGDIIRGAIAGYNTGAGNVRDLNDVDHRTTGKDYSNDVVARAQFFKNNGY
ncbi:uncharacterized protein LOC143983254 isoform X2 [Lithobates pipiens]